MYFEKTPCIESWEMIIIKIVWDPTEIMIWQQPIFFTHLHCSHFPGSQDSISIRAQSPVDRPPYTQAWSEPCNCQWKEISIV